MDFPYRGCILWPEQEMFVLTAREARANLYRLIDHTADSHEPIFIGGKGNSAVLVSERDWNAIQETMHLLSRPDMRNSICAAVAEPMPLVTRAKEPPW